MNTTNTDPPLVSVFVRFYDGPAEWVLLASHLDDLEHAEAIIEADLGDDYGSPSERAEYRTCLVTPDGRVFYDRNPYLPLDA